MQIGIATPCHVSDQGYLRKCISAITRLQPQPFNHVVDVNAGEHSMKQIRERLYDETFKQGAEVVLACSADFFLFPHILSHIRPDQVTDFCALELPFSQRFLPDMIAAMIHLVYRGSWSGCYALPRDIWEETVKPSWDGTDGSIKKILGVGNYHFVKHPQYYAMRPWRKETTNPLLAQMPLASRMKWRLLRVR